MAVFKNGIFAYDNGRPVTPQSIGITLPGIQTCQQFFTSGSITDVTQKSALYILVSDLQNYGIWDKMKAIYPMVGQVGVSSSFQLNLKDPNTFRGTFSGGWTFSSTGATPDGSTGYMDTGFNPFIQNVTESFGIYVRTSDVGGVKIPIGCREGSKENYISTTITTLNIRGTLGTATGLTTLTKGFVIAYDADNLTSQYSNINGTKYTGTRTFNGSPNFNFFIGAHNNGGTPQFYSTAEISFAFIGDRITDTEAANLYTAVQRFQTTLGRQV